MALELREYTEPLHYGNTYFHNLEQIDRFDKDPVCGAFLAYLTKVSGLERELISLEMKRYLMTSQQFFPTCIRKRNAHAILPIILILVAVKGLFKRPAPVAANGIILDSWFDTAVESFYGRELVDSISGLASTTSMRLRSLNKITLPHLCRYLIPYVRAVSLSNAVLDEHGIDLRRFVYRFFVDFLTGLSLKESAPRIIISGQDNGCATIKVKASGAQLFLIQNGYRPYYGDTCFIYADHYVSIGKRRFTDVMLRSGCVLKHAYPLGSLRLYNYLKTNAPDREARKYDVVCVSTGLLRSFDASGYSSGYFSLKGELANIRLYNALAAKSGLKVAYHPYPEEIQLLKKYGVFSDKMIYIDREKESVYNAIRSSKTVLCVVSTVAMESMACGKKVGLVNTDRNACFHAPYKDLDIEFTGGDEDEFCTYVETITEKDFDAGDYVVQSSEYVREIASVLSRILSERDTDAGNVPAGLGTDEIPPLG